MKKQSILILAISFIISIFLVSFYGLSIRDEHMKVMYKTCEILTHNPEMDGKEGANKRVRLQFDENAGSTEYTIDYVLGPNNVTEPSAFEFIFTENIVEESLGGQYNYVMVGENKEILAELVSNVLTFYRQGTTKVALRTTDNSGLYSFCTFVCR